MSAKPGRKPTLDDTAQQWVLKQYAQHRSTVRSIAQELSVSKDVVYRTLIRHDAAGVRERRHEEFLARWNNGEAVDHIAHSMGITTKSVLRRARHVRAAGLVDDSTMKGRLAHAA